MGGVHNSAIRVIESASEQLPSHLEKSNIRKCHSQHAARSKPTPGIAKHSVRMNEMLDYMRQEDQIEGAARLHRNSALQIGDMHALTILSSGVAFPGADGYSGNRPTQRLKQTGIVPRPTTAIENAPSAESRLDQIDQRGVAVVAVNFVGAGSHTPNEF